MGVCWNSYMSWTHNGLVAQWLEHMVQFRVVRGLIPCEAFSLVDRVPRVWCHDTTCSNPHVLYLWALWVRLGTYLSYRTSCWLNIHQAWYLWIAVMLTVPLGRLERSGLTAISLFNMLRHSINAGKNSEEAILHLENLWECWAGIFPIATNPKVCHYSAQSLGVRVSPSCTPVESGRTPAEGT
jgi:hypothetical protein